MADITYDSSKPFKERVIEAIRSTWSVRPDLITVEKTGPYAVFRERIPAGKIKVDHTDGLGTKGLLHWQMKTFKNAVQDVLAMNVNDLALMGATPYRLQDHIIIEADDHESICQITEALAELCRKYKIVISGGETAVLNTVKGFEIGMTVVGIADNVVVPQISAGDVVIGIKSNGLHSNGFTFLRALLLEDCGLKLSDELYDGVTVGEELTKPTAIYLSTIQRVLEQHFNAVHGMMHITGGAFTKFLDIIPKKVNIKVNNTHSLNPHKVFNIIREKSGWTDAQMYKNFNCGIGFVIIADKAFAHEILRIIRQDFEADIIGEVVEGSGKVIIESKFSETLVEY